MPDQWVQVYTMCPYNFSSIHGSWHIGRSITLSFDCPCRAIASYFIFPSASTWTAKAFDIFFFRPISNGYWATWISGKAPPSPKSCRKEKLVNVQKTKKSEMEEQIDFNRKELGKNTPVTIISLVSEQLMREFTVIKRHWNGETSCSNYSQHKAGTDITDLNV